MRVFWSWCIVRLMSFEGNKSGMFTSIIFAKEPLRTKWKEAASGCQRANLPKCQTSPFLRYQYCHCCETTRAWTQYLRERHLTQCLRSLILWGNVFLHQKHSHVCSIEGRRHSAAWWEGKIWQVTVESFPFLCLSFYQLVDASTTAVATASWSWAQMSPAVRLDHFIWFLCISG